MNFLLIDDDKVSLMLAARILEKTGLATEINAAWNGVEAIAFLNHYFDRSMALPDVILLDLNMPVMDGFSFIEAFRKLPVVNVTKVQIIVVSSSNDKRDITKAFSMGVKDYLVKPLRHDDLVKALTA